MIKRLGLWMAGAIAPLCASLLALPGAAQNTATCGVPALAQLTVHRVTTGETLESIASRYRLVPTTILGLNPTSRGRALTVGSSLKIPPFNGIQVEVRPGQTWRDVAKQYGVRPDVLFEVNGCQPSPRVVFVPGVNWSPVGTATEQTPLVADRILSGYPLPLSPGISSILLGFGWRLQASTRQTVFHGGLDLVAPMGTPVLAAGDGVVAFVGNQAAYGNLVVINHAEGLQTRYAQLKRLDVTVGQTVTRGQPIATVGQSGRPSSPEPHLHFEVRSRSALGWVAENPEPYVLRTVIRPNSARN